MPSTGFVEVTELRSRFALRLAELYGTEVPAYNTLVEVSRGVNADVLAARGDDAQRLGDIDRVTAERHGAIRVGSPEELAQVARVFSAFGMDPVGFYDLRTSDGTGVPVVATAFRPTEQDELAKNPFRVFTSMLSTDDSRFFDEDTRAGLRRFLSGRRLFAPALLELADRAADNGGLEGDDAAELLALVTEAFTLTRTPIDQGWYNHLARISSVAADIGGVATTHINHLTPRVLDIAALYDRMQARGIEMIDAIQGPPEWDGPDVLLRQTSFRALSERRWFRRSDGVIILGDLRVRFGEVEQRGIALTAGGMKTYEHAMATIAEQAEGAEQSRRQQIARRVWADAYPSTEAELASRGLGWFTYSAAATSSTSGELPLSQLVAEGLIQAQPIVYEDFLPRSAAGIFRSNLSCEGSRDDSHRGAEYDIGRLSDIVQKDIADPQRLYREQRDRSIHTAQACLGCTIIDDLPICS